MINHTSDAIDEQLLPGTATRRAVAGCPAKRGWRAAGVVFLVVSMLALSAGAFWGFFLPTYRSQAGPVPSALQALISIQAVFLIMFWPLLVGQRRYRGTGVFLFRSVAEYVIFLAASVPLYVVAAYLSDATATDVIRSLLYLSAVATGAMGMGFWARTGRVSIITAVTLAGALIAVGGPAMYYLLVELTDASVSAGWLWRESPATCAFESATARGANWYPTPIWAWALWPATGIILFFAFILAGKEISKSCPPRRDESVFRRNASAMLIAAGATITVQLGTYFIASIAMNSQGATVVTLLVSLLWIVISAPVFAAGGRSASDGLLRGGAVVDAGAVVLVVLAAGGASVGTAGAIKIYLIWVSLALAGCSLVLPGRNAANRHVMAAFAVLLMLAVAAGPFWANGIIMSASSPWRERVGFIVRAANPVFAITECLAGTPRFVWNERYILYEYTVLGRDVPIRAAAWYVTVAGYGIFAFVFGIIASAVRRRTGDG